MKRSNTVLFLVLLAAVSATAQLRRIVFDLDDLSRLKWHVRKDAAPSIAYDCHTVPDYWAEVTSDGYVMICYGGVRYRTRIGVEFVPY